MKSKILIFFIPFVFSGCGIGGYWMNGNPFVSEPGPPAIESWIKPGTSAEQRVEDSKECGGTQLGSSGFTDQQIEAERQPGEKGYFSPLARLHHKWERCMLSKGYQYTGQCLDNSVSRARPACGAP